MIIEPIHEMGLVPSKNYRATDILYDFNMAIPVWSIVAVSSGIQDPVKHDVIHDISSLTCVYPLLADPMSSRLLSVLPLSGTIRVRPLNI